MPRDLVGTGPAAAPRADASIEDPGSLLALLPPKDSYVWLRHGDGLVGWGEVVRLKPASIAEAAEWWADLVAHVEVTAELDNPPAGAGLMAFGSFLFDPAQLGRPLGLIVPQTVVGRRDGQTWVTEIGPVSTTELNPDGRRLRNRRATSVFADGGLSGPEWEAAVAEAVRRIGDGDLDKVVLARDLLAFARERHRFAMGRCSPGGELRPMLDLSGRWPGGRYAGDAGEARERVLLPHGCWRARSAAPEMMIMISIWPPR